MNSFSNRFFRLPFSFELWLLEKDLEKALRLHWQQHFNSKDYSGEWNGIALRSSTGKTEDIVSHFNSGYSDTPLFNECSYFQFILEQLQCEKETVRLLRLAAGSAIKEHRDIGTSYAGGIFRLHIPIRSDTEVSFIVDGSVVPMKAGECWYANFDLPHSVNNNSRKDRIHLVIDCIRNEWSDKVFAMAGYDFSEEGKTVDSTTKQLILEELARQGTEASLKIIQQLKGETK